MICKGCGGDYESSKVVCPYCGRVNEEGLEKANQLKVFQKELKNVETQATNAGGTSAIKKLTIGICTILSVLSVGIVGVAIYCANYEEIQCHKELTGAKYEKNLADITDAIDNKEYLRALTIAEATETYDHYDFEGYKPVSEELCMINDYYRVMYAMEAYFLDGQELEDYVVDSYDVSDTKYVYDAKATTERAYTVKQDLTANLDRCLKYFYQLTDEELEDLKAVSDSYDFEIEGRRNFDETLIERMQAYEEEQ